MPRSLKPIMHGTVRGYAAHYRRGEEACDACLEAKRVTTNLQRKRRRMFLWMLDHPSENARLAGCTCEACTSYHRDLELERYYLKRLEETDGS